MLQMLWHVCNTQAASCIHRACKQHEPQVAGHVNKNKVYTTTAAQAPLHTTYNPQTHRRLQGKTVAPTLQHANELCTANKHDHTYSYVKFTLFFILSYLPT